VRSSPANYVLVRGPIKKVITPSLTEISKKNEWLAQDFSPTMQQKDKSSFNFLCSIFCG